MSSQRRVQRQYVHVFASAACVLPVASYVLAQFGWGPGDIGVATALMAVAGTVSAPLWGWLDDATPFAPRAAILSSAGAAVATAATLGRVSHAYTWAGLAAFGAARGPLAPLLATRILGDGRQAASLGRLRAFGSIGWVVGLVLAATMLTLAPRHARWVFAVAAAAVLTAPAGWGRRPADPTARAAASTEPDVAARMLLVRVLAVVALSFATSVVMAGLVQFTAGWAHDQLGAGPFLALAPIALSALLEWPALRYVDRLAQRYPAAAIAVLAGPPVAVATLLLAVFPNLVTLLAVQPLVGLSFAMWYVGQSRMLAEAVPADRLAWAQTVGAAASLGGGGLVAGAVGGQLAASVGYRGLFLAFGAGSAVATVVAVAVAPMRRPRGIRIAPRPAWRYRPHSGKNLS